MAPLSTGLSRALRPLRARTALSLALVVGLAGAAQAQPVLYGDADGYGGPLIRGEYVGAPFTRVPRPTELVPSAWGYGTYGVPTVAGIRSAPVGTPTVYVIETPLARSARAPARRSKVVSRARDGRWSRGPEAPAAAPAAMDPAGGARVVTVGVPQGRGTLRQATLR